MTLSQGGLAATRDETGNDAASTTSEQVFNWGAEAMHAREAGAVAVERAPVTVAVVDSGVEDTHPDLEGRVDTQRSVKCSVNGVATQDLYGWRDEFYHGTHVAGPIAAKHDGVGVDGVNPTLRIAAINVASRNGKVAVANLGGYSASKFGLVGLGESAFRDLSAKGISITTLCPGWVNTDMAAGEGASLAPEEMIQPEDVAATVRWLLSLRSPVRVMDVLLECAKDVERRGSVEIAKLYALRNRHPEEYDSLTL